MAKKIAAMVKLQCPAGAANPAPPVGTALGPHGVNIMEFCKQFNAKTQEAMTEGLIIPVIITVYQDRSFTFELKTPPAPVLIKNMPYNVSTDLIPVSTIITTPNILVVNNDLPVKTIQELIAYGKGAGKGKLSYGSSGPGSTGHLSATILLGAAGIEIEHVPYKTSAAAFPDVISGRVSMAFDSLPSTIGFVRGGKVRPILVMSEKRSSLLPDVPTAAESGYPTATMNFWMGIEAPAKTPQPVVERLATGLKAMMESKEVRDQMANFGADHFYTTPAEFKKLRDAYPGSLRSFHDAALKYGGLPVSLIRWGMGLVE